ncbi:MAG TPA: M48 family metallopeptidase [Candidatus Angelobacter sp.]|jgi:predicted Zn-dependent protease|nr:M48 family metallopeptidase [Candidatus Angelobacter sp.]
MRRWLAVTLLIVIAGAAVFYAERHKPESRVGPEAVLNAVAETQREISRVPAHLMRLSDEEEIQIGDSMAARYSYARSGWQEETDTPIEKYINLVGRNVAARARRKLDYRFHYIPDPGFVNAFALPDGHIFIGKGFLLQMDTEDELANVLGHEVEHVDHYHCAEKIQVETRLRDLPLSELLQLPIELFQAGYGKEQELEADRDGTHLAVMAGYSPQGALRMFEAFERLDRQYVQKAESPDEELSQVAIESIIGYFRSHPLPQERARQVRQMIVSEKWPERPERPLRIHLDSPRSTLANGN